MQITTQAAFNLVNALSSLNGYQGTIKDGDKETITQKPYRFDARTRLTIAKNLAKLQAVVDAYQKVRGGLIMQISSGKTEIVPPPPSEKDAPDYKARYADFTGQIAEFNRINQMFLDERHEIGLLTIPEAGLALDVNPIPLSTLAQMAIIMEGEGWSASEELIAFSRPATARLNH